MKFGQILKCDRNYLKFLHENDLIGTNLVISLVKFQVEEMIFFRETIFEGQNVFEIRIYKNEKNDTYRPHPSDNLLSYQDTEDYISFFFTFFTHAHSFLQNLPFYHIEYAIRPKEINRA